MHSNRPKWTIYTDGGCIGNPGPGGYGAVMLSNGLRKELTGGYRLTTNNRMELMAAIKALSTLQEPSSVVLYSDSRYLVDGMNKGWAKAWRANQWRRKGRQKALNADLWKMLLELAERHTVKFVWVEGHAGNRENERCDRLTQQAASRKNLPADRSYEQQQAEAPTLFDQSGVE
jgi:ribonuclease HI